METDDFYYKSYCELGITSQEVNSIELTRLLGIEPFDSYNKGDTFLSRRGQIEAKRFQNLWVIKSETLISKKEDLSPHFIYFERILRDKFDVISKLKKDRRLDLSFWIWIETDNAGIGIDLSDVELAFINKISNRIHFSLITGGIQSDLVL